jgi:hypothetical protein
MYAFLCPSRAYLTKYLSERKLLWKNGCRENWNTYLMSNKGVKLTTRVHLVSSLMVAQGALYVYLHILFINLEAFKVITTRNIMPIFPKLCSYSPLNTHKTRNDYQTNSTVLKAHKCYRKINSDLPNTRSDYRSLFFSIRRFLPPQFIGLRMCVYWIKIYFIVLPKPLFQIKISPSTENKCFNCFSKIWQ